MEFWIARDFNDELWVYDRKPLKSSHEFVIDSIVGKDKAQKLPISLFPEVNFYNSPYKIGAEIILASDSKKAEDKSVEIQENHTENKAVMKLWKVHIKTYRFGIQYYDLFVLADTESNMLRTVHNHPVYKKDKDSDIESYKEIDLISEDNRVL